MRLDAIVLIAATALLAAAGLCAVTQADIVQTAGQRFTGPAKATAAGVSIGGRTVPWTEVLYTGLNEGRSTLPAPHVLWLAGGDRLTGTIQRVTRREVVLVHPLLGSLSVDRAELLAMDLWPDLAPLAISDQPDEGLLVTKGEPLPGDLLWLDREKVGIDSLLGTLELPVEDVRRYVFPNTGAKAAAAGGVSIRLIDGSALRGRATFAADAVALQHPVLGSLQLPFAAMRTVFFRDRAWFLGAAAPAMSATPLVTASAASPTLRVSHDAKTGMGLVELRAQTTANVQLPEWLQAGGRFRAAVQSAPGTRGTVRLTLRRGSQVLAELLIRPGDPPQWLEAAWPQGTQALTLTSELVPPLRWPASIQLIEPVAFPTPRTPDPTPPGS